MCVCVGGRARQACPAGLETQSVHSTLDLLVYQISVDKASGHSEGGRAVSLILSAYQRVTPVRQS